MTGDRPTDDCERYRAAMLDWLAGAARGRCQRAALAAVRAGDGLLDRVATAAAAGHVLNFGRYRFSVDRAGVYRARVPADADHLTGTRSSRTVR